MDNDKSYTFEGWLHKVYPTNEHGKREIIVRDCEVPEAVKYPNFITFVLSKNIASTNILDNVANGTKCTIQFFINGFLGTSKTTGKEYHINNLLVSKIQFSDIPDTPENSEPSIKPPQEVEDLPF